MRCRGEGRRVCAPCVSKAAGAAVGLVGIGLVGTGLWARRDVARVLAAERIEGPGGPVRGAAAARTLAETIRASTLEATGGRTYGELAPYLDADGNPTGDSSLAARDERTGAPLDNPEVRLSLQATTLQTALMQAFLAFRLAELTAGLGASLVAAGVGLAAAGRR
jgi:hypothetical protein